MANGVEGRYPFLDHRVFDYAARLPPPMKLDGLNDKIALRQLADRVLPAGIARRHKQPYRAPGVAPFFGPDAPDWVEEVLEGPALEAVGIWDPPKVAGLLRRCREGRVRSPREEMTLVAVLSTQLWHREFMGGPRTITPEPTRPRVRLERRARLSSGATA
jgi:asparagine synthase (glutamine-hydrolysing)